jgi:acyl-CoA hydrolase
MTGKREVQLRLLAEAVDEGFGAKIQAGAVMKWIDQAAYACATGWSGRRCIAACVGETLFARPIHAGDLVDVSATLTGTGRTSMRIIVRVATADPRTLDHRRATQCVLVFVALDDDGRPVAVPALDDSVEPEWAPLRSTNPDWAWNSP